MHAQLRILLAVAAIHFLSLTHAVGDVGDQGTMDDACGSPDARLQKLCQIVHDKFKEPQQSYVHLGGDFYLVSAPNTGRVAQGIYVANVKSGRVNLFGGYGSPEIGEVLRQKNGVLWIRVRQSSMSRGHFWELESLLELRMNPITKTPFLIRHDVHGVTGLGEEKQFFCSQPENSQSTECSGLGETVYLNRDDIDRLRGRSAVDRITTERILAAHQQALRVHKRKKYEGKHPYQFLEDAGIWRILDVKPATMSTSQYVHVLNDYAFFAHKAVMAGRTDLAIAILDKVIRLSPGRAVAYLNMAEALEVLAEFGATQYAAMPLDEQTILALRASAANYRDKYRSMLGQSK